MPFLTVDDGCEIYYETHGKGPAITFASGFMGITDIWRAQFDHLSDRYLCIAFDNRGAGRSEKPLPRVAYGVDRHAADLAYVLSHLGVSRSVAVGHSMGGNTVCLHALTYPRQVAGIVLIGSYASGKQIVRSGGTPERIRSAVTGKASRVAFYESVGLPHEIAMESAKWELYALLGNAESFLAFDVGDGLGRIRCPALVIHGDRDIVSPLDPCGLSLRDGLADSKLEVFSDTNHCPMTERPEATNLLIDGFLATRARWT